VKSFLDKHAGFTVLPIGDIWSRMIGSPCPTSDMGVHLSPATTDTDGFYCAVLERSDT